MEISTNGQFGEAEFKVINTALILVEGLDAPRAQNFKSCLNSALMDKYDLSLGRFFRDFTSVTDDAAVMARIAFASVSREIHELDEKWLSCIAHGLNNAIKSVMSTNSNGLILEEVAQDFRSIKELIEDGSRSVSNH